MNASNPLSATIRQLFADGDLEDMRSHLLHSTAWVQHGRTHFGNEQMTAAWMVWLANCGLSDCSEAIALVSEGESLEILTLKPKSNTGSVRVAVWNWHNREFIRRLVCIPDTDLLGQSLGINSSAVAEMLPLPDPLLISDYDQQQHPFSVSVTPGDLAKLPAGMKAAVEGWWSLWQDEQLAAVGNCYSQDAKIQLPGRNEDQSNNQLVNYASGMFQQMQRRYCHPESVLVDPNKQNCLGVLWHMEGDMASPSSKSRLPLQRVRNTLVTYLEFEQGKIVRDTLIFDQAALIKRLSI
jgi:hypothetical protein